MHTAVLLVARIQEMCEWAMSKGGVLLEEGPRIAQSEPMCADQGNPWSVDARGIQSSRSQPRLLCRRFKHFLLQGRQDLPAKAGR